MARTFDIPECFRPRLDDVMRLRGIDPAGLATMVGCSPQHVYQVRRGVVSISPILARALQRELGEHAWQYLLGKRSDPPEFVPTEQRLANQAAAKAAS